MTEAQTLRLVDPATGEITEQACPNCQVLQHTLDELTRKHHGALSQIGRMRADREQEARASTWWGWAVALFQEWKVASGRLKSQWTADRFWLCQPFLERSGYAECRYAVWGLCANPMTKRVTAKHVEVYDSFELTFRTEGHFERYRDAGVAIFGASLPEGDWDRLLWIHRRRSV